MPSMPGLTRPELVRTLTHGLFEKNLAEITGRTHAGADGDPHSLTAGFAVLRNGNDLHCSSVALANTVRKRTPRTVSHPPHTRHLDTILEQCGDPTETRMVVVAHSEPQAVWPTSGDIRHYSTLLKAMPGLIIATAAPVKRTEQSVRTIAPLTHQQLGRLTILRPYGVYAAGRLRTHQARRRITEQSLAHIGLHAARMNFQISSGKIVTGLGTAKRLY